jgi:small subunit ribosomal protein S16
MAVVIRLARHGRLHRPFYRVVAIDERCHREGKANEILGTFDPLVDNGKGSMLVDVERVHAWIKQGARVSEALTAIFKKHGVALPAKAPTAPKKARAAKKPAAKKDGKKFVPASRRSVKRHQAAVKAKKKAESAAAAAAAAPAAEAPKA